MGKSSDDLRRMLHSMYLAQKTKGDDPSQRPSRTPDKLQAGPSVAISMGPRMRIVWLMAGTGGCAVLGLVGLGLSQGALVALGLVGSLIGAATAVFLWKEKEFRAGGATTTDAAIEVIRRKSLEMERDRLREELEDTHGSLQNLNDKILNLHEELVRARAEKAEWLADKEKEIRGQAETEMAHMRREFELERENLKKTALNKERHDIDILHHEASDREKLLEDSLRQEIEQSKKELANREDRLKQLSAEIVKLQDALDRSTISAPVGLAEQAVAQNKALEEERKSFQKRFQDQEAAFQKRVQEIEAAHARDRRELEMKLEELNAGTMRLQEALDRKVVSSSSEVASHLEEARNAFQVQKEVLQRKLAEQETRYRKMLEDQEEQSNAQKLE
ncbi:MAG: hypothetical protein HY551_04770, partial [Elusimicrobia bacterium]|nr:hypothetical protein [Elusimicrobiota bacterium]